MASDEWSESCAGLEEIAQKGQEQLADHSMPADPDSAAEEKEELLDSKYGGGQDTEPLRPSTTGMPVCHPRFRIIVPFTGQFSSLLWLSCWSAR